MATSIAPTGSTGPARFRGCVVWAVLVGLAPGVGPAFAGFEEDLAAVVAVGPKGEGSAEAAEALRRLSKAPADRLPALFAAFNDAGPVGRNLLAGAVQSIADDLPPTELIPKLAPPLTAEDAHPEATALAFDLTRERFPLVADRYIAKNGLDSPVSSIRRVAVAAQLDAWDDRAEPVHLKGLLERTLDRDQVELIAKRLADAGEPVDLQRQFGFLTDWQLVGPFDHRDGVGWDRTLPPEETPGTFDPDATYPSKHPEAGGTVTWQPLTTDEDFGTLDVAGDLKNWKGAAVMLAREYQAPAAGPVTFRLGTPNAFKLYLNGELVFARAEYHRGTKMDQYVIPAEVRAGRNLLMVKLLQNEQDQSWAQSYQMQFRVTDPTGAALREPESAAE